MLDAFNRIALDKQASPKEQQARLEETKTKLCNAALTAAREPAFRIPGDAKCSAADAAALLKGLKEAGIKLEPARIPREEFRNSWTYRVEGEAGSGSHNEVVFVESSGLKDGLLRVFKPAILPSEIDSTLKAWCTAHGMGKWPDFNGHNLAARALDVLIGWNVMVECEPAQLEGRMGIVMSHGGAHAPTDRTVLELDGREARTLWHAYVEAISESDEAVFRFLAQMKFLAILPGEGNTIMVVTNLRTDRNSRMLESKHPAFHSQLRFEWQALKLLRKGLFDFLVMNLDAHSGNYVLSKEVRLGLQAFDYDHCFSDRYVKPGDLPREIRYNLDIRVELPRAIDLDSYNTILKLDEEEFARVLNPFLRPEAVKAGVARLAYLKQYLADPKIEKFPTKELDPGEYHRVEKFKKEPWTSYIGRDFTYRHHNG